MCLITEQNKPIKIRKDRIVYKKVKLSFRQNTICSLNFGNFTYTLNKLYETDFTFLNFDENEILAYDNIVNKAYDYPFSDYDYDYPFSDNDKLIVIAEGFHSASAIKRFDMCDKYIQNAIIVKCTIPKGSLIYKDKTGLIVSNKIIVDEIVDEIEYKYK